MPQVQHFNVVTGEAYSPYFNDMGFKETAQAYQVSILDEELQPYREWLWHILRPVAPEVVRAGILSVRFTHIMRECVKQHRAN